jgi:hypothetical protein
LGMRWEGTCARTGHRTDHSQTLLGEIASPASHCSPAEFRRGAGPC